MTKQLKARIIGTGRYLPERVLSNADLEKMVDTSDEWIMTRTGMRERRIAEAMESASEMGVKAALKAVESSKISADKIDLIIVATLSPDHAFPSTASIIQHKLGMKQMPAAFDISAACSGFIYGLELSRSLLLSGAYKNILFIASEKLSSTVNYNDRNTCILFGDGASAVVLSSEDVEGFEVSQATLGSDGSFHHILRQEAGGSFMPATEKSVKEGRHFLSMDGKEVFKHAVRRMESASIECLAKVGLNISDIRYLVPHQANIRIIEALRERFDLAKEKVFTNIEKYGNTSAASVGIALSELLERETIRNGEHLLLTAFGAGLTWGSLVLTKESGDVK